ncbi:hypothetical protein ACIBG8_06565 [Nonomuraea sp. NPDC050556]|uniref:hypothetical protein n=1 Tax=Nonomuraea sp. NPDC050556 TaxID=3364369 RepID=UPI00379B3C44
MQALIRMAKLIGTAMTQGGELGNLIRAALAPRLHLLPGFKQRILSSATPPLPRSSLVAGPRLRRRTLAGRLCPNPILDGERRFDDVAAGRFAMLSSAPATAAQQAEVEQRGGILLLARPGSELHRWLRRGHVTAAIVRPDGTVLRAGRDLSSLCANLPCFTAPTRRIP